MIALSPKITHEQARIMADSIGGKIRAREDGSFVIKPPKVKPERMSVTLDNLIKPAIKPYRVGDKHPNARSPL